ncbi:translation initiation factor IF-2 [Candidatus Wirthbacteria bacterium CG2_30_54_11]|uniref:Translation initiation factor IF-2 n=1 Tax=Candidatus Wirthbacteria bacterium CG2_30_54_11 TaxID=1817892 RepID=A0A1J5J4J3_9BACT|nr:MAG: translation initiation factor IF-2 [Candidatus Wirthbacteria bacterium CG2_30_54_11]
MLTITQLASELKTTEEEILQKAVQLHIRLQMRGQKISDSDAIALRGSYDLPKEDTDSESVKCIVSIPLVIPLKDLAVRLETTTSDVLKVLISNGVFANINDELDYDTAAIIADEFGFQVAEEKGEMDDQMDDVVGTDNRLKQLLSEEKKKNLKTRPPIVTVMGHVDHGKTSLLDAIRNTAVTVGEAGGITQHIGAYQVEKNKRKITFIDTPGHEAFTQMRARGAQVTDIAVLVVSADDSVQPQTIEAMNHAKAAGVPIIVAMNKIDKPGADIERVKRDISQIGLVPEDWGGPTICVPVSAKKGTGIEDLLEMILLVADMGDLKANPDRAAIGTIIEAKKTASKGVVATVLVQAGTLHVGDAILVGSVAGRVKSLFSDTGKKLKEASPSMPAEIAGLSEVPEAGDIMQVMDSDRTAQQLAKMLERRERALRLKPSSRVSLESFYAAAKGGEKQVLNIILKTDVKGSAEAIKDSFKKIQTDEVSVDVVHEGTGDVSPSDITLAAASNAVVMGFNTKVTVAAQHLVQATGVDVRTYQIIYKLIEDVQKAMGGLLSPEEITILRGRLVVRGIFTHSKDRWTIGGLIQQGFIKHTDKIVIKRGEEAIGKAEILSIRREANEVKEVKDGVECGIMLRKVHGEIKEGDFIDVYIVEKRERAL